MKSIFNWSIVTVTIFLASQNSYAFDFEVKGFVAMDLLAISKQESKDVAAEIGYGTADVKFYFNHEEFSSKVKLDIDGGTSPYDLMEEVLISYRASDNIKYNFGKGKIRFHEMHYGITDITYTDGGYLLNTYHSFRDQDRKYLANLELGRRSNGLVQNFTLFGSNQEARRDFNDESLPVITNDKLVYTQEKTFNTTTQRGLAYQIQILPDFETKYLASALYYWRDIDPDADWAFNVAYNKNTPTFEFWFEYIFAYTSKHPNDNYTQKKQYDMLWQLGYLYKLTDKWGIGFNFESAYVRQLHHDSSDYSVADDIGQTKYNDGQTARYQSFKLDMGGQCKVSKKVQFNTGVVIEKQFARASPFNTNKDPSVKLSNLTAYGLNAGFSFFY